MPKQYRTLTTYSSSKGNDFYIVKVDEDGNLSCDCKGWIFSSKRNAGFRSCKHTKLAEVEFAQEITVIKEAIKDGNL